MAHGKIRASLIYRKISRLIIKMSPNYNDRACTRLEKVQPGTMNKEANAVASLPKHNDVSGRDDAASSSLGRS